MTEQTYSKPIPNVNDPEMGPFWQAARQHRLTAQHCTSCGAWNFPALPICPGCLEQTLQWDDVPQEGTVWSFATYHRAFHPGFKGDLPYVVVLVETAVGITLPGLLVGPRDGLAVGAKVKASFVDATDEFTLPAWELLAG